MTKQMRFTGAIIAIYLFSSGINAANARDYYVSKNGSDSASGTSSSPWRTIKKAMSAPLNPGDRVVVRPGIYNEGVYIRSGGSASADVTLLSEVPGGAKITPPDKKIGIQIAANFVTVDGFEVFNGNAGGIVGSSVHHVTVSNNISHDNSGSGIFFGASDFLTIDGNEVYRTASAGVTSGLSILHPQNVTGNKSTEGFRIVVRNNIFHHNKTITGKAHTDGNGMILDDYNCHHSCNAAGQVPYKFKTLVENNISYSNGGKGIQVAFSSNATIRNNTAWHNSTDLVNSTSTWKAELSNMEGDNNLWVNNIAIADPSINKNNRAIMNVSYNKVANSNVRYYNNITYSGKSGDASVLKNNNNAVPTVGNGNKLGVNPRLVNAPTNFRLQSSSPAIDSGTAQFGLPAEDIDGGRRSIRTVDMGAYEQ
jgi:serralysin